MQSLSSRQARSLIALLLLIIFVISCGRATAQTPDASPNTARDSLIRSIQEAARNDVAQGRPLLSLQDLSTLYGAEAAAARVSMKEVKQTYEDAYQAAEDDLPFYVHHRPTVGWLLFALLVIYIFVKKVWNDTLYPHLKEYNDRIYRKHAGYKFFHRKSLRSYRQEMIAEYKKFKPPFATERELDMSQVYVPLNVKGKGGEKPLDAFNVIESQKRLVVTGTPGAGKSMLLKRYALSYATESAEAMPEKPIPVFFPLRRLNEDNSPLIEQLATVMEEKKFLKPDNFIASSLERGALMLLFDGLDEVNSSKRVEVISKIKEFLRQYDEAWTVITCRTAIYDDEFNEVVKQTLEVQPFTDQEIQSFLYSWKSMPAGKSPEQLFLALNDKPSIKLLARNPLLLTMIVILYSDLKTFELPYSRAAFYKSASDAFLNLNKYKEQPNNYQVPQKRLVLEYLALYNQDSGAVKDQDRISMDFRTIIRETEKVLPELGLKAEDAAPLLKEIVEQSGLLMSIDGGSRYQFSHLTLQEYFTASALKDDATALLDRYKKDPSAWRETALLWCGLDHDSTEFIREIYNEDPLTAFQCLADALKINPAFVETIIEHFKPQLGEETDNEAVTRTFALVAAGPYERNQKVFNFLSDTLSANGKSPRLLSAAKALALTNKQAAAQLLASLYHSKPEVHTALTQMGDLAVEAFAEQARYGNTQAIVALQRIGTPKAAASLLPLLWYGNTKLETCAAKSLAVLFSQQNVLEYLRKQHLTQEQKAARWYEWVWEPFMEPETSALPVIAGRIVYLLDYYRAYKTDHLLDELLGESSYMASKIAIPLMVATRAKLPQTVFDGQTFDPLDLMRLIQPDRLFPKEKMEEEYQALSARMPKEVLRLAEPLKMANPDIGVELLKIATGSPPPSTMDWVNIRKPSRYNFANSWHFTVITLIIAVLSLLTILGIIFRFSRPILSFGNAGLAFLLLVTSLMWIVMFFDKTLPTPEDVEPYLGPYSIKKMVTESTDMLEKIFAYIFGFLFLPMHLYFSSMFLLRSMPWQFVVLFLIAISTMTIILWRTGIRKERLSNNPLRPLVNEITLKKEVSPPLVSKITLKKEVLGSRRKLWT